MEDYGMAVQEIAILQSEVKRLKQELAASQKRHQQKRNKWKILKRANARLAKSIEWNKSERIACMEQVSRLREAWATRKVDFEHEVVTLPFQVAEVLDALLQAKEGTND